MINYPNLPNSALEITEQPQVKEITSELLRELESALNNATLWKEQVNLINTMAVSITASYRIM